MVGKTYDCSLTRSASARRRGSDGFDFGIKLCNKTLKFAPADIILIVAAGGMP